jgi:hypothetical protein
MPRILQTWDWGQSSRICCMALSDCLVFLFLFLLFLLLLPVPQPRAESLTFPLIGVGRWVLLISALDLAFTSER